MNSLSVRKSILRTRAMEFSRLLLLSMLEDANDTFSAMLTVLSSELGQCNLSVDQFLQVFGDLIGELRSRVNRSNETESIEHLTQSVATPNPTSSSSASDSNARPLLNNHAESNNVLGQHPVSLGHFSSSILSQPLKRCKNCHRSLSLAARKPYFKGYCSSCYQMKRFQQSKETIPSNNGSSETRPKELGSRQCSDCLKYVPKGGVFYRSARLCKNCYERHRLTLRRAAQKLCSTCNKVTKGRMTNGRCPFCFYGIGEDGALRNSDETVQQHILNHSSANNAVNNDLSNTRANEVGHRPDSTKSNSNGTTKQECSHLNECNICKKSDEELDTNGKCPSCQRSILSVKVESAED